MSTNLNMNAYLDSMNDWSPDPAGSLRGLRLVALKERLLREHLMDQPEPEPRVERLLRLAAGEAEALAWQSPVPLLVMPSLLDEKLAGVRRYLATQSKVLARAGPAASAPGPPVHGAHLGFLPAIDNDEVGEPVFA